MQLSSQPTKTTEAITLIGENYPDYLSKITHLTHPVVKLSLQFLQIIRDWIEKIQVKNLYLAKVIERLVPAQCPFERDIKLFSRVLFHIPPLCKLNPIYDQLIGLRFRALCYLAEQHEQ